MQSYFDTIVYLLSVLLDTTKCVSREWMEANQLWVQQVSSSPCTRMDVMHLQEQLDLKLQQRQARETGICPVRRELYSQCFGEREIGNTCSP